MKKKCFVPTCLNSSGGAHKKVFITVPRNDPPRKYWFDAVGLKVVKTTKFCCEDHFNLKEDSINFNFYKRTGKSPRIKSGVLPHLFLTECNTNLFFSQFDETEKSSESDEEEFPIVQAEPESSTESEEAGPAWKKTKIEAEQKEIREKFEEIRLQKSAQVDSADYVHPADLNGISSLTSQDTNGFEHLVGAGTDYECSTSKRIKLEEDNGTNDQAAREAGEELYSLISSWSELLAFKLQTFDKTISERLMRQIDQLVFDTEMRVAKETSMEVSKSLVPETNQNSSRRFLSVDTQPGTVFATSSEHQLGAFETESHAIEIKTEIEEESSCDRNEIGYEYEEVEVKPEFLYMVPESTGDQLNKQSSSVFVAEDIKNEVVEEPGSGDKAVATENNQHLEILHTQHELNEDRFGERLASESHTKEIKIEPV